MKPIQFECPHCREIITGDESQYGRPVTCGKCQATILVPPAPVGVEPQTARLVPGPAGPAPAPTRPEAANAETEIFNLSPTIRAFLGQLLLGVIFIALGIGLATRARNFDWANQAAMISAALGGLLFLVVWIRAKSSGYRLTTQRLFVRRGWLAKHVDELELYRVKDVVVDQGVGQRLLGYGTITVLADDDSTPTLELVAIANPVEVKEAIRNQYRAARQREGVRPTEFMRSP